VVLLATGFTGEWVITPSVSDALMAAGRHQQPSRTLVREVSGRAGDAALRTRVDRLSGKDVDRPQLTEMLRFVRAGDVVIVHSLDRLARNLDDLRRIRTPRPHWSRGVGGVSRGAADVHR